MHLDNDCGRWLELWNLVFMQFNQAEDGTRLPLPKPGVDTGMGLERIASAVQGTPVNFDNDLFRAALDHLQILLGDSEEERANKFVGYRVIADHGRAATFLLADGVLPGNVGPGYVLRMIIRRAARFGRKIGFDRPFMADVADVFIDQMAHVYPELRTRREHVLSSLTLEEDRFTRTLDSALAQLEGIVEDLGRSARSEVPGEIAFNLYATHGLPLEITRDVVQEFGLTVDDEGFNRARDAHAAASGAGAFGQYEVGNTNYHELLVKLTEPGGPLLESVDNDPYSGRSMESEIVAILHKETTVQRAVAGQEIEVVTAATPFYVEAGGEVSDIGYLTVSQTNAKVKIEDMREPVPGLAIHLGRVVRGELEPGQVALLEVDNDRRMDIRRNHTATHILHRELRAHLGAHVLQAGSLVAPDRLRFDFTHGQALDRQQLTAIETDINRAILTNYPVTARFMGRNEAIDEGAMALFGEKYDDVVRTIQIGPNDPERPYSFELCGGLHVRETAEIGLFRFVSEGAVGAGTRRVEAVTGRAALALISARLDLLDEIADWLGSPIGELDTRVDTLLGDNRRLSKELQRLQRQVARTHFEWLLAKIQDVNGVKVLAARVDVDKPEGLREMADWFRDKVGTGAAVFATVSRGKPLLVATVTDDLIARGVKAGHIVSQAAKIVGGDGGGRANLAQAGGGDEEKLEEALATVPSLVHSMLTDE
jgi:alanyl-tRNA synthetase